MSSKISTAVLFSAYGTRASYNDDWQDAFNQSKSFLTQSFNISRAIDRKNLTIRIKEFDLIILLHSVNANNLVYLGEISKVLLDRKGVLFSFIGNELNLPGILLSDKIKVLKDLNVDVIATQLIKETGEYLYSDTKAKIIDIPHALNSRKFKPSCDLENRSIDIGLRSFRYNDIFLGDQDRNNLIDTFSTPEKFNNFKIDISTTERLMRSDWIEFLNSCKATISNEAGGHWIDKDDATTIAIKAWLKKKSKNKFEIPKSPFLQKMVHKLPWDIRQKLIKIFSKGPIRHESLIGRDANFHEVFEKFFSQKTFPPQFSGKCISSRHFDAAGTKTCQIMIEGRYNDILLADEHYIPLKRDFSNLVDVLIKFEDFSYRKQMVDQTYEYIKSCHTYSHRIEKIEKEIYTFF